MQRYRARRGMSLIEIMMAMGVLSLAVITAMGLFPVSTMLRDRSGSYSRAAALVQRKLEQVKQLPPGRLTYDGLRSAGIIDAGSTAPYSFTATDSAVLRDLPQAAGTVRVTGSGTDLVEVEILLTWRGLRGSEEQARASTQVARRDVWVVP